MKTILVTGGCGFIGSNFICYFLEHVPDTQIINIDTLTYAGNPENLQEVKTNPRYHFHQIDIRNKKDIETCFKEFDIQDIVHFAAESHVDNSIACPEIFLQTNILGTFNLLEIARNYWIDAPLDSKSHYQNNRFLHISTDEVYGSLGDTGYFSENSTYAPNSPYSASKASSDMLVRSYHHTYGLNTLITHCSNNFGPKQHIEKLIPTIIRTALAEKPIPIYGNGQHIRDWLYVEDHCKGLLLTLEKGTIGETYTIGGNNELTNLSLCQTICDILDTLKPRQNKTSYTKLITFVKDRPGHDKRYAIDASKIKQKLGWQPSDTFHNQLHHTITWYINHLVY